MKEGIFVVNNPLLTQAICGGMFCDKAPLNRSKGYLFASDDPPIGRAFLEYCYSIIFGIHRVPGYENYYARGSYGCSWMVESGAINITEIVSACKELEQLYEHTQKHLQENNIEVMTLYRTLNRTEINSMESIGDGKAKFRTNIMSSYTQSERLNYAGDMKIRESVRSEDILMIDNITSYAVRQSLCDNGILTGEYEVWVLTKNPFGERTIGEEDIIRKNQEIGTSNRYETNRSSFGDCSVWESCMIEARPCEYNWFSRWLTKRNMKKIQKLLASSR